MSLLPAKLSDQGIQLSERLTLLLTHSFRGNIVWAVRPEHLVVSNEVVPILPCAFKR